MHAPTEAIESRLSSRGATVVGVRGKKLVAAAVLGQSVFINENSVKTHPGRLQVADDGETYSSLHAEIAALTKIRPEFRHRAKLFVCRIRMDDRMSSTDSRFTMARPCPRCIIWMLSHGISLRHVFYTDALGTWQRLG